LSSKLAKLWKAPCGVSNAKIQQEDVIKEIKRHSFYLKPGEKQRTKEALAQKRNHKKPGHRLESVLCCGSC
jgi:ribosomal protein S21